MNRISPHPLGWVINAQNRLHFTIQKIWIHQSTLQTCTSTCIFSGTNDRCPKGFSFCHCLLGWYNHLQQDSRGTLIPHQTNFQKNYRALTYQCNSANATSSPKRSSTLDTSSTPQASYHYHQKLKPSTTCTHQKQLSRYAHSWDLSDITESSTRISKRWPSINLINLSKGQVWMDTSAQYSIYDTEGCHYTGTYLMLPWSNKEIHSVHGCIRQCMWSTTISETCCNQLPHNLLISHIHWNTEEVEFPRTGGLQSVLCHNQMELLPSRS